MKEHMAVDQYGQTYHSLGPYPRKELLERLCRKHAGRIYRDTAQGARCVGWIIAGLWLTVYVVTPMEKAA